jgi:hypothetical protein
VISRGMRPTRPAERSTAAADASSSSHRFGGSSADSHSGARLVRRLNRRPGDGPVDPLERILLPAIGRLASGLHLSGKERA